MQDGQFDSISFLFLQDVSVEMQDVFALECPYDLHPSSRNQLMLAWFQESAVSLGLVFLVFAACNYICNHTYY